MLLKSIPGIRYCSTTVDGLREHYTFLTLTFNSFSQNQTTKQDTKNFTVSKPEIDRLYEKYKSSKEITLFTPYGNLDGNR